MKHKKYPGRLGKPTREPDLLDATVAGGYDQAVLQTQSDALNQLFQHYGLAPNQFMRFERLAMALAYDHVPAFKIAWSDQLKTRGRPRTGSDTSVYSAVESLLNEKPGLSVAAACLILARKSGSEFSASPGQRAGQAAKLRRRYYRHRQRLGLATRQN